MPSINPSRPTLFAPTLLALSLAMLGAPAQAAERYWTFIGGCGSADWFGMPSGSFNAQGQSNCWAASGLTFPFPAFSGQSLPTSADDVFIQHSSAQDLGNTLALPGRDASLFASAKSLTVQGLGQGFASLAIDRNGLNASKLYVGTEGKGAIRQTGSHVVSFEVFLGRSRDSVGRYELSGGRLMGRFARSATTAGSFLFLGQSGVGELVQSGGELGANYISVGNKVATSLTSSWTMTGGAAGADVLGVGTVPTFNPSSGLFSGLDPSAFGRVEVSGSAQLYVDDLGVGLSGRLSLKGGEIQLNAMTLARTDAFIFNDGTLAFSPTRNGLSFNSTASSRFENFQGDALPLLFGAGFEAGLPTVRLLPRASLTVPEVQVGSFGRGRLEVLAGASLKSDRGGVGASALPLMVRSEALLDGTVAVLGNSVPASWTVRDRLDIGGGDMATITVRNGALLKTGSAAMGDTRAKLNDTERNEVRIEGSGSRWQNTGDLWVGGGAAGVGRASDLWLVNGGRLTVGGTLQVHAGSSLLVENGGSWSAGKTVNEGLIEIAFGTMTTVDGPLELRGGSRLYVDGPLTLNGSLDVASGATLETLKELQLNGLVTLRDGAVLTGSGTKEFAGGLSVGNSPGVFTDNSSDALVRLASTNIYFAEIGGTSDGSFDRYILNGQLHLGGTLKLISWAGYGGQAGASFDLFDGELSGSFDQINTTSFALASGLAWDFSQLSSTGVVGITAVPEPGTWALWLGGLAALGASAARRRSRC